MSRPAARHSHRTSDTPPPHETPDGAQDKAAARRPQHEAAITRDQGVRPAFAAPEMIQARRCARFRGFPAASIAIFNYLIFYQAGVSG
jgi:hypothetical protein